MKRKTAPETNNYTIHKFSSLTGFDRHAIGKRLEESRAEPNGETPQGAPLYRLRDLVRAILGGDIELERLRLIRAQADSLENKLAIQRREYIPASEAANIIINCGWSIRRVILALPIENREKDAMLADLQKLSAEWTAKGDQLAAKIEEPADD